jgi:DNA-binding GntR family transcriptional regulator
VTDVSLDPITIDRSSPIPLYYQAAQYLEKVIEAGELTPGMRLENEIELAGQLGLSRPTMRRAMEYLVDKGLVARHPGIGTHQIGSSPIS